MFPRHASDFDRRHFAVVPASTLDIEHRALEEVQIVNLREDVVARLLIVQVLLGVRRRNNGQISSQRPLHQLVEVVGVVMAQKHGVYSWQLVQIDGRVCPPGGCHAGSEMDVVAGVKEVRVGHQADAFPFDDGGGGADEVQMCIFGTAGA